MMTRRSGQRRPGYQCHTHRRAQLGCHGLDGAGIAAASN